MLCWCVFSHSVAQLLPICPEWTAYAFNNQALSSISISSINTLELTWQILLVLAKLGVFFALLVSSRYPLAAEVAC